MGRPYPSDVPEIRQLVSIVVLVTAVSACGAPALDTDLARGKLLQTTKLLEMSANRPTEEVLFTSP